MTLKEGPRPRRRTAAPKGWAVGVPYSAATARNRLRNGVVSQRLCAAPSSRSRSHVPTYCSLSLVGSPAPPWVAGSPVAFLVATPWWPPAAALPVWTFCGAQYLGKAATLVPSRWSSARRLTLDTSLAQYVGRLSHDRTTEKHWQRLVSHRATVPKEVPCGSSTPAAAHATSPRSSVPFFGGGRPGWSGGFSLGPLPPRTACHRHRRITPTARYRRSCT